jgi:hypothetical protein
LGTVINNTGGEKFIMAEHQNDHDLLIRLDEKVTGMIHKLDNLTDDHEKRIRTLEIWRWISIGAGAAGGAGLAEIINKYL